MSAIGMLAFFFRNLAGGCWRYFCRVGTISIQHPLVANLFLLLLLFFDMSSITASARRVDEACLVVTEVFLD